MKGYASFLGLCPSIRLPVCAYILFLHLFVENNKKILFGFKNFLYLYSPITV